MIFLYLADGFEEVEAITVVDLLRRADIDVRTVSIMERRQVSGAHGIDVMADILFEDADHDDCEMIVLPGGGGGADRLDHHEGLIEILEGFYRDGKWIAAICAAPMILGHHEIFNGERATIYEGMEAELKGAVYNDEKVVMDGKLITSKGPATAMDFALKIIEVIKGSEEAVTIAEDILKEV